MVSIWGGLALFGTNEKAVFWQDLTMELAKKVSEKNRQDLGPDNIVNLDSVRAGVRGVIGDGE